MTGIPEGVRRAVEVALEASGATAPVRHVEAAAGGCINHGAKIEDQAGAPFFLKWNPRSPPGMFAAESEGLHALAARTSLRVPRPLASGEDSGGTAWLLMEYVPRGSPGPGYGAALALGLAELHAGPGAPLVSHEVHPSGVTDPGSTFGWPRDNWIGSLAQDNTASRSWATFWRDRRLEPQLRAARDRGAFAEHDARVLDRVIDLVDQALPDGDHTAPQLVHGDLWSGNTYPGPDGVPVLIDPAVYRGRGEVDVAMSELFGGFGAEFYSTYAEACGLTAEYAAFRRDLYQLYYLLVHVNLFGSSYVASAAGAARAVAGALSGA